MFGKKTSLLLLAAALSGAGCQKDRQIFEVKGVVKELKTNGHTAVIAHETIPGYMDAMTMDFEVKNKRELEGFKAGENVAFRLIVVETKGDAWIENLRKLPAAAPADASQVVSLNPGDGTNAVTFRRSPIVEPLNIGDVVPDYKFTNQLGQPIALSQFRGRALGLTFFFTRCPLPTFCPRMAQNFQKARNELKTQKGGPQNWSLLSISFDPAWDTPERLNNYGKTYAVDTNHWQLATSDLWNIDGIADQLGLTFYRATPAALPEHNLRTVVIDARGRLQKVFVGNEWEVSEFTSEMIKAAAAK